MPGPPLLPHIPRPWNISEPGLHLTIGIFHFNMLLFLTYFFYTKVTFNFGVGRGRLGVEVLAFHQWLFHVTAAGWLPGLPGGQETRQTTWPHPDGCQHADLKVWSQPLSPPLPQTSLSFLALAIAILHLFVIMFKACLHQAAFTKR